MPAEASIDDTGLLSIRKDITAGTYYFVIRVTNDVGFDTLPFAITVEAEEKQPDSTQPGLISPGIRPPVIRPPGNLPLDQEGSELSRQSMALPQSSQGTDGSALSIKYLSVSSMPTGDIAPTAAWQQGAILEAGVSDGIVFDDRFADSSLAVMAPTRLPPPPNTGVILWSDKEDCYTSDRFTVNGARDYVFWTTAIKIQFNRTLPFTGFYGTGEVLGRDNAVWNEEKYHPKMWLMQHTAEDGWDFGDDADKQPNLPRSGSIDAFESTLLDGFARAYGANADGYYDDFLDAVLGTGGSPSVGRQLETPLALRMPGGNAVETTVLHYGLTVDAITSQKGGQHMVGLGDDSGTVVSEDYFSALQENPQASLTFAQDGAAITFAGTDIIGADDFYGADFGYIKGSRYEQQMTEAAGLSGDAQYYTYAFAHHGDLPGIATFDIMTDITEGANVNVYRYDTDTGAFTQIAANLKVGTEGLVSYRNDSMSDYLITTATVEAERIGQSEAGRLTLPAAIAAVLVPVCAAAVVFFIRRKKRLEG